MNNSEQLLSAFAEEIFFKEFVIDDLCYTPENGSEVELADLLINLDSYIIAIQLKSRSKIDQTNDENIEDKWLKNKCKIAKSQVKNTVPKYNQEPFPHLRIKEERALSYNRRQK